MFAKFEREKNRFRCCEAPLHNETIVRMLYVCSRSALCVSLTFKWLCKYMMNTWLWRPVSISGLKTHVTPNIKLKFFDTNEYYGIIIRWCYQMITWFSISSARVCLVSTLQPHLFRSMLCICVYQFEKRIANVLVILACITATRNPNHHPQSFAVPFTERLFRN